MFNKAEEERGFSHNYYLIDRRDFNAAAAFEDFDPEIFKKGQYAQEVVDNFASSIKHFITALGTVFALKPVAHGILQRQGREFLQGLADLGYMPNRGFMASRCGGNGSLRTERFLSLIHI